MEANFCTNCGAEIAPGTAFCTNCGQKVIDASQQALGAPAMPQRPVVSTKVQAKKRMNMMGMISSGALLLTTFFPYASISFFGIKESQSLIKSDDAAFFVLVAIIAFVFALIGLNKCLIGAGAVAVLLMLVENIGLTKDDDFGWITKEIGYYLLIITSICILVAGVIGWLQKKR